MSDGDGNIIAEQNFEPGAAAVAWNGLTTSGAEAPRGRYTFSVRYGAENGETEIAPAAVFATVLEARRQGGEAILLLDGGGTVASGDVEGIRWPQQTAGTPAPTGGGEDAQADGGDDSEPNGEEG